MEGVMIAKVLVVEIIANKETKKCELARGGGSATGRGETTSLRNPLRICTWNG
jgi:hypothetical protein